MLERQVLASLPVLPLANAVLLPGMMLPLTIVEAGDLELVDAARSGGQHIGVPLLRGPGRDSGDGAAFEAVFGVGRLIAHTALSDRRRLIRLEGVGRARRLRELPPLGSYREVVAEPLPEPWPTDLDALAVLTAQLEQVTCCAPEFADLLQAVMTLRDLRDFLYAVTSCLPHLELALRDAPLADHDVGLPARLLQRSLEAESADQRTRFLSAHIGEFLRRMNRDRSTSSYLN